MEDTCPLCGRMLEGLENVSVDEVSGFVLLGDKLFKGQPKTRKVLRALIDNSPRVLSRAFLMDNIYGLLTDVEEPSDNIMSVYICRIREGLRGSSYEILTVWGKGWLFRKKIPFSQELKVEKHNGREENQQLTG